MIASLRRLFLPCLLFGLIGNNSIVSGQTIDLLDFSVLDAEYSYSLDQIVMVSEYPGRQLHIYDPVRQHDRIVELPLETLCVSIAPDGYHAAVGHDGYASYVDLNSATINRIYEITAVVSDLVLAGNGYMYAFPGEDQWVDIHSIELATGVETLCSWCTYAGTHAKLHPSGTWIYGADNHISPSDIEKYDISTGILEALYDSPYHGDYPMCGNLWLSKDGLRIFTSCSYVFRSSDIPEDDMTYNGSLGELSRVQSLEHAGIANKVFAIPGNTYDENDNDTEIQSYDYTHLTFDQRWSLPQIDEGENHYPVHGKFIFAAADSTLLHVVIQVDETSGLLNDYGIVTYSIGSPITYDLQMTDTQLQPGDLFRLDRQSNNSGNPIMVDEYLLLELFGSFWFWPNWTVQADYATVEIQFGQQPVETILTFSWPSGAGTVQGVKFWGAYLHAGTSILICHDMIEWEFSD